MGCGESSDEGKIRRGRRIDEDDVVSRLQSVERMREPARIIRDRVDSKLAIGGYYIDALDPALANRFRDINALAPKDLMSGRRVPISRYSKAETRMAL
jgi:hypothetical protein